ncbi:Mitochondrial fission protein ELM1 [Zea mays]|uniref:Mitochondrial fission protein ELM1 n=1 Tax=Zea mays TaxID=4577 RepID=A0A1D6KKT3_MAIZE|nr:Mitochondrial fission protein ELM1 [Zea mays]
MALRSRTHISRSLASSHSTCTFTMKPDHSSLLAINMSLRFDEKMVLAVFRDLIILWMTKSLMDDVHGWGVLFDGRVGDITITVYIWNGEEPKPNKGHLAWADAFVITADSISMLSEACSIGLILKNVASLFMNKDSLKGIHYQGMELKDTPAPLEKFFAIELAKILFQYALQMVRCP